MVNYKCLRCGYSNNNKLKFTKHLNRKFICKPKLKDISRQEIYDFYFKKDEIKFETVEEPSCILDQMMDEKRMKTDGHGMKTDENGMKTNRQIERVECLYCKKTFFEKIHFVRFRFSLS